MEEKIANLLTKTASLDCKVQSLEAKLKQKSQFVLECVNKLQTEMLVEKEEYVEPEYSDNLIPNQCLEMKTILTICIIQKSVDNFLFYKHNNKSLPKMQCTLYI